MHLEIKIDILKREHKIDTSVGAPQVAYRETLTRKAEIDYTHKKQSGGSGQFAKISLVFEPGRPGRATCSRARSSAARCRRNSFPALRRVLNRPRTPASLRGFPVIDFKIQLVDGGYHDVDSSVLAFEIAARAAFKEGMQKAGPVLLEPIMNVEVVTPSEFMGDVIGDLNSRRGQITGTEEEGGNQVVKALVPLEKMFGYISNLRSFTRGGASYTMEFDHYEAVPKALADEVRAKVA